MLKITSKQADKVHRLAKDCCANCDENGNCILLDDGEADVYKRQSDDPEKMKLKFYSAFGGVNGSIGAKSEFDLPLSPECKEIYVLLSFVT